MNSYTEALVFCSNSTVTIIEMWDWLVNTGEIFVNSYREVRKWNIKNETWTNKMFGSVLSHIWTGKGVSKRDLTYPPSDWATCRLTFQHYLYSLPLSIIYLSPFHFSRLMSAFRGIVFAIMKNFLSIWISLLRYLFLWRWNISLMVEVKVRREKSVWGKYQVLLQLEFEERERERERESIYCFIRTSPYHSVGESEQVRKCVSKRQLAETQQIYCSLPIVSNFLTFQ